MKKIQFHSEHLALEWDLFKELFKHLPAHIVKDAWSEANPKPKKVRK